MVVIDPNDGSVTGGGWIYSQRHDYRLKPVCDKANFGFSAQYDRQMRLKGNFTFHLNNIRFKLNSTNLDWLIINDDQALFGGGATVNGVRGYKFIVEYSV